METPEQHAYRVAYSRVAALQLELARPVYSAKNRALAEQQLEEALQTLDRARSVLSESRKKASAARAAR